MKLHNLIHILIGIACIGSLPNARAVVPPPDSHANLWFDSRVPFMREDAGDVAAIQLQQAQTIAALVMQGFDADSVKRAVVNNDMGLLKHSGLTSVQLHKPGEFPPPAGSSKPGGAANGAASGAGRLAGATV